MAVNYVVFCDLEIPHKSARFGTCLHNMCDYDTLPLKSIPDARLLPVLQN
jgi:hypothetical protein